jgi:probable phosphoglycerate mutase
MNATDPALAARLHPIPFWFLRHGETDWNAQGLSQGSTDIPLNAVGLAQARRAARTVAGLGQGIATIVSSPLSRTRVTAEIVAEALRLPIGFDADLREVGFGEAEGQPMGDWYDDWIAGRFTPAGGETFSALYARGVAAVNRATALPGPVLIVAHGALFRALRRALGHEPNVRTPNALPILCAPPAAGEAAWSVTPAALAPEPAAGV